MVVVVVAVQDLSKLVLLLESSDDLDGCREHSVVVVADGVVVVVVEVQDPIGSSHGSSN